MADKPVTDKLQRRVARVLIEMAELRAKRLAARLRLAGRSSTTPTAKGPQCPRCTILTEDGGLCKDCIRELQERGETWPTYSPFWGETASDNPSESDGNEARE